MLKFLQQSESPRIISPTNISRASESLTRLTLDAANQSTLSPTFLKYIYHLISAARAAEFSAEGADCSWPKLDLRPSIFSKVVDNFIDVFREEPVTCLEDRPERRFLGPRDPSNVFFSWKLCLSLFFFLRRESGKAARGPWPASEAWTGPGRKQRRPGPITGSVVWYCIHVGHPSGGLTCKRSL